MAADYYGTLEETRRFVSMAQPLLRSPEFVQAAVGQGWATQPQLETMGRELQAWGERPDAFFAVMYCAAVAWVSARP